MKTTTTTTTNEIPIEEIPNAIPPEGYAGLNPFIVTYYDIKGNLMIQYFDNHNRIVKEILCSAS